MNTTINDVSIETWELNLPEFGMWRADATATNGPALKKGSIATIKCGGLTLSGKVELSKLEAVSKPRTIVVGGLGWTDSIKSPLGYQSDGGIRLKTVVDALASAAGERYTGLRDLTIGTYYELIAAHGAVDNTYQDALNELVAEGVLPNWWVDNSGLTHFDARPAATVTARATEIRRNMGLGSITYGLDDPAQFMPGNLIDGEPIRRLRIKEEGGHLTAQVFFTDSVDSQAELVRRIVRKEMLKAFGDRERTYVVNSCDDDGRCDLKPPPDSPHMPELNKVEQWLLGKGIVKAQKGDLAIVQSRDDRRTRPAIVRFQSPKDGGPYPLAARQDDSVTVLMPPMVLSGTSAVFGAFTGVAICPLGQTKGTIDGGGKIGVKT